MFAPISVRGLITLLIGLFWIEASPFNFVSKFWADKIPDISLIVVPLFPTSKVSVGAVSPWSPLPWTVTFSPSKSISIPSFLKQDIVDIQSSPVKNPEIFVSPFAKEPNITALCDIDLSPGIFIWPFNFFIGFIVLFIIQLFSFIY